MLALLASLQEAEAGRPVEIAFRIAAAAVFGGGVAMLYLGSRDPGARTRGFAHTLVLLAPLIAMVTIAVGQNVAAAFTLVGTLAIVRFRAAVRDSRDMAFVIFSVAVGMALGAANVAVAAIGLGIVGATVLLLRWIEQATPGRDTAQLRIGISPPDADASVYAPTLARYATHFDVVRSSVDRQSGLLELRLAVSGLDPRRTPQLLTELLQLPDIVRASFAPEEIE
jgi:hypothetical protein